MTTLTTKLYTYRFNIEEEAQRTKYNTLCERLQRDRECSRSLASNRYRNPPKAGIVVLEIEHLFADQWNSTTHRLYDWFETIYSNYAIKEGYYLKITGEMRDLRRSTRKCGYCGARYLKGEGDVFCDKCLDAPHLKQDQLPLLRLLPIKDLHKPKYPELTEGEREALLPLYVAAQTTSTSFQDQREKIEADRKEQIDNANTQADGLLWLMDHKVNIDNVIYYEHTGVFCFGWRTAVSADVASTLIKKLANFPYTYEVTDAQGQP